MTQPIRILPFTVAPQDGRYRVFCSGCGRIDIKSLHGIIKCDVCNTCASAHDMLMDYQKREQFLDSITRPAAVQCQHGICKNNGGGV